jgi:hypothetical protein
MAKKQNTRANFVLKYLRWRNTDPNGEITAGYVGEVFDQEPTSSLPNIPLWVPVPHGQGGHWSLDQVFDWSWRQWLAALLEAHFDAILPGGSVLEIGVGPQMGLTDPLLGLGDPLWDFRVCVSLALAEGQERMVYLHPRSDGGLRMCDVPAEERITACWRAGRGISSKLHAMYPKDASACHAPSSTSAARLRGGSGGIARWVGEGCRRRWIVVVAAGAFNGGGFLFVGLSGGASRCSSSSYSVSVLTSARCRRASSRGCVWVRGSRCVGGGRCSGGCCGFEAQRGGGFACIGIANVFYYVGKDQRKTNRWFLPNRVRPGHQKRHHL